MKNNQKVEQSFDNINIIMSDFNKVVIRLLKIFPEIQTFQTYSTFGIY